MLVLRYTGVCIQIQASDLCYYAQLRETLKITPCNRITGPSYNVVIGAYYVLSHYVLPYYVLPSRTFSVSLGPIKHQLKVIRTRFTRPGYKVMIAAYYVLSYDVLPSRIFSVSLGPIKHQLKGIRTYVSSSVYKLSHNLQLEMVW